MTAGPGQYGEASAPVSVTIEHWTYNLIKPQTTKLRPSQAQD